MTETPPRLRASARRLRYATLAAILLFAVLLALGAWATATGRQAELPLLQIETGGLAPWPAAATMAAMGVLIALALFRLARMLRKVEEGAAFATAGDLRGFAFYLFLAVLATILVPPIGQLLAGGRAVELALGGTQLLMLLITALLFLVARLLDEAQAVADDASQIV